MKSNTYIARFVKVLDDLDKQGIRIPGLLLSHPGAGKTSTIDMYCRVMDYNLVTVIPSQNASDDILGLQSVNPSNHKLERLAPSWFNKMESLMENGKRTILFIDEISTCDPFIQAPLLNLIFNRDLGERKLPENVLVLAAGNYQSDLDGAFKMSAPLVNRFLLLNLWPEDFDISEVLKKTFLTLNDTDAIKSYLKMDTEKPIYSFSAIEKWAEEEREFGFSKNSEYTETPEFGILGFSSIRSLTYSLQFIAQYIKTYADNLWMRVAGDTLGFSVRRDGKPMRAVFENNADKFGLGNVAEDVRGIGEICKDILDSGVTSELCKELLTAVNTTEAKALSNQDLRKFSKVVEANKDNKEISYLNDILTKKIVNEM